MMHDNAKLAISLLMDILGMASGLVPVFGWLLDVVFAPLQAIWLKYAYDANKMVIIGFLEELLPFTDFIPSCTIAHIEYLDKKKN